MAFIVEILRAVFAIAVLIGFCCLLSVDRKAISWRLVAGGLGLQLLIALLVLKVPEVRAGVDAVSGFFVSLMGFATEGAKTLFGPLVDEESEHYLGYIFAVQVLPSIVFFSALTSFLYYIGFLQKIVFAFAWVMSKTMRLSGAESVAAAANVFIGQTEAPMMVKPYLERMSKSEVLCLMTGGMATIAGAVLVAYIGFLGGDDPEKQREAGTLLLTASLMAAPAAIVCAKVLFPEKEEVDRNLSVAKQSIGTNVIDAIAGGTTQGVKLAVNVGAILLVFVALIAMLNHITEQWIGEMLGINERIAAATDGAYEGLTLQFAFGLVFSPVAFLVGVDFGTDTLYVGQLLGEKLILNEFIAYQDMSGMIANDVLQSEKAIVIATFALCGFANLSSMGIQIGGISVLAPSQRENLAALAVRALVGGTVASLLSATMAGVIIG